MSVPNEMYTGVHIHVHTLLRGVYKELHKEDNS